MIFQRTCAVLTFSLGMGVSVGSTQDLEYDVRIDVQPGAYCRQWTLLGMPIGDLRNPPGIVDDGQCAKHPTITGFYTGSCSLQLAPGTYLFFAADLPEKPRVWINDIGEVFPVSVRDRELVTGGKNRLSANNDGPCFAGDNPGEVETRLGPLTLPNGKG